MIAPAQNDADVLEVGHHSRTRLAESRVAALGAMQDAAGRLAMDACALSTNACRDLISGFWLTKLVG